MTDWNSFRKEIKAQLWPTEELEAHDPNALWHAKHTGQVIHHPRSVEGEAAYDEYLIDRGFSTAKWLESRVAGLKKTSTAACRTVTNPGPTR